AGVDPDDSALWGCGRFPPNGFNNTFWCDPVAEAALDHALAMYDRAQRRSDYFTVQRRLAAQVPVVFLYRGRAIDVYPKALLGVRGSASGEDLWSAWNWRFAR